MQSVQIIFVRWISEGMGHLRAWKKFWANRLLSLPDPMWIGINELSRQAGTEEPFRNECLCTNVIFMCSIVSIMY